MRRNDLLKESIYYPDTHISSSAYMGELAISSLKTIDTHHTELEIPAESASELAFDEWEQDTLSSADELKFPDTLVHNPENPDTPIHRDVVEWHSVEVDSIPVAPVVPQEWDAEEHLCTSFTLGPFHWLESELLERSSWFDSTGRSVASRLAAY